MLNSQGKHLCWSLFLKKFQAYKRISCLYVHVINISKIQYIYCYFSENTSMDFQKVIYENVKKKTHSLHNKRMYIYTGHRHF